MNAKDFEGYYMNAKAELLDIYKANPDSVTDAMINTYLILKQNEILKNEQNKLIQNESSRTKEYVRDLLGQHLKALHDKIDTATALLKKKDGEDDSEQEKK